MKEIFTIATIKDVKRTVYMACVSKRECINFSKFLDSSQNMITFISLITFMLEWLATTWGKKVFLEKNSDSLTWNGPNMYNMYTKKYFSCFRFVHDILNHISRPATKFPNMYKNPTKPFVHNKKVFLREKGKWYIWNIY